MGPACRASAALTAGGLITTGGLTALVGKIFHTKEEREEERFEPYNSKEK
jgi:hypothetical protein